MTEVTYTTILSGLGEKSAANFRQALEVLARDEADSVITKTDHEWLKVAFNNAFEAANRKLIREPFMNGGAYKNLTDAEYKLVDGCHWPACHTVGGYLKRVQMSKITGAARDALFALYTEAAPIGARVTALKAKIGKRPPKATKTSMERDARAAKAMTCQICGRGILAETGVIAHHGYERPGDGYQTESCPGARELPFETDREVLKVHIEVLKSHHAALVETLNKTKREEVDFLVKYQVFTSNARGGVDNRFIFGITRENFDAKVAETPEAFKDRRGPLKAGSTWMREPYSFDVLKDHTINALQHQINQVVASIEFQTGRYDGWVQTHIWAAAGWTKLPKEAT